MCLDALWKGCGGGFRLVDFGMFSRGGSLRRCEMDFGRMGKVATESFTARFHMLDQAS